MGLSLQTHVEAIKGTPDQNRSYCSGICDDGTPKPSAISPCREFGNINHHALMADAGDRDTFCAKVKSGESWPVLMDTFREFTCANLAWGKEYFSLWQPRERYGPIQVSYWWGPSRAGKSHAVRSEEKDLCTKDNSKWFNDYRGQPAMVLDDFYPSKEFTITTLLQLFDSYEFWGQTKGGYVCIRTNRFYITSNVDYRFWQEYLDLPVATQEAFDKRITDKREFQPRELLNPDSSQFSFDSPQYENENYISIFN